MDKSPLATLSPELRLRIYNFACPFTTESIRLKELPAHKALLQTCRQIYHEAKSIFDISKIIRLHFVYELKTEPNKCQLTRHLRSAISNGTLPNLEAVNFYLPFQLAKFSQMHRVLWLEDIFDAIVAPLNKRAEPTQHGTMTLKGPDNTRIEVPNFGVWKKYWVERFRKRPRESVQA